MGSSAFARRSKSTPLPEGRALAAVAARQYGLVTVAQLKDIGFDGAAITRRIASSQLHRLYCGVYAVGHTALTQDARWLAAVLACGPFAVLSHHSAAIVWDLIRFRRGPIDVSTSTRRGRADPGIRAHRATLDPADVTQLRGIPITTPARTLLDLAAIAPPVELQRAVDSASRRFSLDDLSQEAARSPIHRGTRQLRQALSKAFPDADRTRSELEIRMLRLVADRGLPRPEVNATIGNFEVDLFWRSQSLIVELGGYATHSDREPSRTTAAAAPNCRQTAGPSCASPGTKSLKSQPGFSTS